MEILSKLSEFNIITAAIVILTSCLCFVPMAIYHLHMYQLNGYKIKEHLKWIYINFSKVAVRFAFAVPALVISLIFPDFALLSCVFFIFAAYINRPKEAKKPLVYTNRVKRLCITMAIVFSAVVAVPFAVQKSISAVGVYVSGVLILLPLFVILCDVVNKPLEMILRQRYVRKAKKILSSCEDLKIIGVTGSFGKTSVKYFLDKLLSAEYNVLKTPGNYNTTWGAIRTINENLKSTHEIFICEMGARNVGDIKEICDLVHPQYGIITSVGEQHLETFKTVKNIIKTKFELYDAVHDKKSNTFLNFDNELIRKTADKQNCISYGVDNDTVHYYGYDISVSEKGSQFKVRIPDGSSYEFETQLIGKHNVLNIVSAISVAHSLGISLEKIAVQVRKLESVPHRMQLVKSGKNIVIDDAYNSNPAGARAALETLGMFGGTKILITPGMVELGARQDELNKQFGRDAAPICDYIILVGKEQTKSIYEGIAETGFDTDKIYIANSLNNAISMVNNIKSELQKIILLENDLPDNF